MWPCSEIGPLMRSLKVKMRSLVWVPTQHEWDPFKKRKSGQRQGERAGHVMIQGKDGHL